MGIWGRGRARAPPSRRRVHEKNLREMGRNKQSSMRGFGALSEMVILVQLLDDSFLAGNGNSKCSSRFSSASSLAVLALRPAPYCGFCRSPHLNSNSI